MITLYNYGPNFLLPDPSPFVLKTQVQLMLSGLPFVTELDGRPSAPKGKLPYIRDGEAVVADSVLIRQYLETKYAFDLDADLDDGERAVAWTIERMIEESLFFPLVYSRWQIEENFCKGPSHFFDHLPDELQGKMREAQRQAVLGQLYGQGTGRHTPEEVGYLAGRSYDALSRQLGDKPFIAGDRISGTDASAFGHLASIMTPFFDSPVRAEAMKHDNLIAYRDRLMRQFFPDYV